MIKTIKNTQNVEQLVNYDAGKVYNLPAELAIHYITIGVAIEDKSIDNWEVKDNGN